MRDLAIAIEVDTERAEAALARIEQRLQDVEKAAKPAGDSLDDLMGPELKGQLEDAKKRIGDLSDGLAEGKRPAEEYSGALGGVNKGIASLAARGPLAAAAAAVALVATAMKAAGDAGANIEKMAKQSRMSTDAVQQLTFVAQKNGQTFGDVSKAVDTFTGKLVNSDQKMTGALKHMGFEISEIERLKPDVQFMKIGKAIGGIEDPATQAAAAVAAFGPEGLDMIAMFEDMAGGAAENAPKMSDLWVRAMSNFDKAIDDTWSSTKNYMNYLVGLPMMLNQWSIDMHYLFKHAWSGMPGDQMPVPVGADGAPVLRWVEQQVKDRLAIPGDPAKSGVFGQSLDFTIAQLNAQLKARNPKAPRSNVLPFVRPELQGEWDWNTSAIWQAQQFNNPGRLPGMGPGTFPGWAPLSGQMEGGLPWTPYASNSAPQNRPSVGGKWMQGAGGRFLGAGLSAAASFIPGMSQQGSMIGSSFGGALGSLKSVSGMLGSFAPFLGPLAGIAGGLIGKMFGPSEKDKAGDARNSFISDFGGMNALTEASSKAGFSLDGLMNAKKVADVEREVRKLTEAMGAFDQKVADAHAELDGLRGTLDATLERGKELGYNFDEAGNLVSVSFEKMQEKAKAYGIDLNSLGPTFQRQRIHAMASEIINDFTLLDKGGADFGATMLGMSDEISKVVQDSIKFKVDIPANMKPWIENLIEANKLTDENGVAITDITKIKFGEPVATEFEKITAKIGDLIAAIAVMVERINTTITPAIDNATRDRTMRVGVEVNDPDGLLGRSGDESTTLSMGGFVGRPRYLSAGGFVARGTDTVPAMLTPGEGVLRRDAVSRLMRGDWPSGGQSMNVTIDNIQIGQHATEAEAEVQLGRALVRGLKRKGVRLNAA